MNPLQSTLTKRFLVRTLIIVFLSLSSIYIVTIYVMDSSMQEQIQYRDDLISRTLSKRISFVFTAMENDLRLVSPYVLKDSEQGKTFYSKEMQRMVVHEPLYLFIQAFDEKGNPLTRVPDVKFPKPLNLVDIQYQLSWRKTSYISNMMTLPDGRKTIVIAYPALDENGEYHGGVIGFINLNTLSEYLDDLKIGQKGMNAVTDRDLSIIAHSNENFVSTSLRGNELGEDLQKERYGTWQGYLFHEQMIVAYRPLSVGGLGLIVGEPLMQAMSSARKVTGLLFQGFLFVLLVSMCLSVYGTSRVVKPILELIRQAKEYKENKRKRFDPLHTKDELEDLFLTLEQMAKELTHKERKLFYILESIPYGVITMDPEGRIMTFNRGAEKLTQYQREEAIGNFIFDLPLKEEKEQFLSWITLKEGRSFEEVESYIYDKNQRKRDVRLYSSLFFGEDQRLMGIILVMRDVSEIKKLEAYIQQRERLASLGQLTAGIAHEIKNPLSIIQAAAEAIGLEVSEAQAENPLITELTSDILESADRMNFLLTDFLKLSKGDAEDSVKSRINLAHIVNELLHLLRKNMTDQKIRICREFLTQEAFIEGNKNRITQVFLNILLNSIQAMEEGGVLCVRIKDLELDWEVEIEDTGKGIPATKLQWIFNPFYSTKREGTGLGLSIAHEIVVKHGGKLWAASREGAGTTLFVQLPKTKEEGEI